MASTAITAKHTITQPSRSRYASGNTSMSAKLAIQSTLAPMRPPARTAVGRPRLDQPAGAADADREGGDENEKPTITSTVFARRSGIHSGGRDQMNTAMPA